MERATQSILPRCPRPSGTPVTLKVAFASYPMLWQRSGGLQVQIRETMKALRQLGCDAKLFDFNVDRLDDYDLLHVFGAINGNDRIVAAGAEAGVPVVISPVLHPPFSRREAALADLATRLTGRLTHWQFSTTYEPIRRALTAAQAVVALGPAEKTVLERGYGTESRRITTIPNGVARYFFGADERVFREQTQISGSFLLQVSSISEYKNPLASARVAAALRMPLVLIGQMHAGGQALLSGCRNLLGDDFFYLGALAAESGLLSSAYAAASVLLLPSQSEVMPLVVMEALAAGTPVVMTRHSSLQFDNCAGIVEKVNPTNDAELILAVRRILDGSPSAAQCKALVEPFTWTAVGQQLAELYAKTLRSVRPAPR